MVGEIIEIQHRRKSINGNKFIVVIIRCEDGRARMTHICPDYRNYARWKPLLKVGKILEGLVLKDSGTINADSFAREYFKPLGQMTDEELFKNNILQ
jgi:hypothetical protein